MANGQPISAITSVGTPDVSVQAILTCDPRNGRAANQYANPACFSSPEPGLNGQYQTPYIKEPATMDHDISLFKTFPLRESRNLQFRYPVFNFLNHPYWFFQSSGPGLALNFNNGVLDNASIQQFGIPTRQTGSRTMQFSFISSY